MTKFCTNCGSNIENNQEKCLVCGKVLKYTNSPINETKDNNGNNISNDNYKRTDNNQSGSKSKIIAIILALFLGTLGMHNFYLDYKTKGIAQLLITTIGSLACGIGIFICQIWVMIDFFMLLLGKTDKDANGNLLVS
ncbi:MAG: TM2 domain-containing protein [Erysipelotrichales bacterium]|nr:TM2 domain-containing protein [Erysipelotrichales bacterium]